MTKSVGDVVTYNFARNNCIARFLFLSCVLSSVQKMRIPVGLWVRSTAVSTLFTFWPEEYVDAWVKRNNRISKNTEINKQTNHYSTVLNYKNSTDFWRTIPPAPPDLAVVSSISLGSITNSTSSAWLQKIYNELRTQGNMV